MVIMHVTNGRPDMQTYKFQLILTQEVQAVVWADCFFPKAHVQISILPF